MQRPLKTTISYLLIAAMALQIAASSILFPGAKVYAQPEVRENINIENNTTVNYNQEGLKNNPGTTHINPITQNTRPGGLTPSNNQPLLWAANQSNPGRQADNPVKLPVPKDPAQELKKQLISIEEGRQLFGLNPTGEPNTTIEEHKDSKTVALQNTAKENYWDIKGHWAQEAIYYLINKSLVNGVDVDGIAEIQPQRNITRAEFAAVLARSGNYTVKQDKVKNFKDVAEGSWYKEVIEKLSSNGIIEGYQDNTFGPDRPINRAEIVALIARVNNYLTEETKKEAVALEKFSDVDENSWYYQSVMAAKLKNIVDGYSDGTFRPLDNATRAEAFTIIARYLKQNQEIKPTPTTTPVPTKAPTPTPISTPTPIPASSSSEGGSYIPTPSRAPQEAVIETHAPIAFNTDGDDDKDGLTNEEELINGTDPKEADSDRDGISDVEEILAGTSPVKADTDGDGIYDGAEKIIGTNPLVKNSNTDYTKQAASPDGQVAVSAKGDGNLAIAPLTITPSDHIVLNAIGGLVGKPVNITSGGFEIQSADITFKYDKSKLDKISEDNLTIYWVDEKNKKLVPLKSTIDKTNSTVTATTNHFSYYLLGDANIIVDLSKVDVVFAIDQSGSMEDNDPNFERVKGIGTFIDLMKEFDSTGTRVSVVEFSSHAYPSRELTNDRDTRFLNGLYRVMDGTNLLTAIDISANRFDYDDSGRKKIIILVTDGAENCVELQDLYNLTEEIHKRQVSINTIAVGNNVNKDLLKKVSEAANGSYFETRGDNSLPEKDLQKQMEFIYRKLAKQIVFGDITEVDLTPQDILASTFPEKYNGLDFEQSKRLYTKDHANLLTGNYLNQATDISISSPVQSMTLERTYNSNLGNEKTILGHGWRLNYDTRINTAPKSAIITASVLNVRTKPWGKVIGALTWGSKVTITSTEENSGQTWHYIKMANGETGCIAGWYVKHVPVDGVEVIYGSGTKVIFEVESKADITKWIYKTPFGVYDRLYKQDDQYHLIRKDQSIYSYDLDGKLLYIKDRNDNGIRVNYNNDKIISVNDNVGRKLEFTYDADGNLSKVATPEGSFVEYKYDLGGKNLASVTDLNGKTTHYNYFNDYQDDGVTFKKSKLRQIIDPNGNQVIKNDYDPFDRIVRQYDGNNNVKYQIYNDVVKDENGKVLSKSEELARYYVDENKWESKITFNTIEQKPVIETYCTGLKVEHKYYMDLEDNGNFTDITDMKEGTDLYRRYISAWEKGNKKTKEIIYDKKGYKTEYEYDKWNNLVKNTDELGQSVAMQYNENNDLVSTTDKKDHTTSYSYIKDQNNQNVYYLDTVKDHLGNETKYEYYTNTVIKGLVKKITQKRKNISGALIDFSQTEYYYEDGYNNRTQVKDTFGNSTYEIYDLMGRLKQVTNPGGSITKYEYDPMGRLLCEEDHLGKRITYKYDNAGNRTHVTDRNNNTTEYIYDAENQPVKVIDPQNRETSIKYDRIGNKIEETNARGASTKYTFDALNRLVEVEDALGNKTKYEHDYNGNITKVTDTLLRETSYEYDRLNRKTKEIAPLGKITQYTYDPNNNLETVKDAKDKITKYEYDALNRNTVVIDGLGLKDVDGTSLEVRTTITYDVLQRDGQQYEKITQTDALGRPSVKELDALGRTAKITDAKQNSIVNTYDQAGNLIRTVDARQNATEYQYNELNRLVKVIDALNDYEEYEYDDAGNNTGRTDKKRNRTEFRYNSLNQLEEVINPLKKSTKYTYDEVGNRKTLTDPCQNTISYEYDLLNRLVAETDAQGHTKKYGYDEAGKRTWESSRKSESIKTQYKYDALNRLEKVIDAHGTETKYTFDLVGNTLSVTDGKDNTIEYTYDGLYRLTTTKYPGDETILPGEEKYQYDILGRLTRKESPVGAVETYEYDELGRVTSHTRKNLNGSEAITVSMDYDQNGNKIYDIDGNKIRTDYTYDELNRLETTTRAGKTTTNTYDKNGNLQTKTDWRNNTYTYQYDELNRLIEEKDPYNKTVQKLEYYDNGAQSKSYDALNNLTQYSYDKNARLISTIDPEGKTASQTYDEDGNIKTKTDGENNTTTYEYDNLNRLKTVINAKGETTAFTYDKNSNLLTQTDGKGNITTYEYNAQNKAKTRIDHAGAGIAAKTESYTYYADGSLKTKTDRNKNTTSYWYDSHGRLKTKKAGLITITYTYDDNGNQLTITDNTGTTLRTYDEFNRVKTKTVPYIGKTTYQYDIIWGIEEGCTAEASTDPKDNTTTKIYDRAGRLWKVTANNRTTTYSYYDNGSRQGVAYPDGSREDYTYYKNNLLWTLTNKKADGTLIDTYTYTYDDAYNQTSKVDAKGKTDYTYDALNRLDTVTEPNGRKTAYTYDRAGNRETETITEGSKTTVNTYAYNEQNRLLSVITRENGATVNTVIFDYDNNGNQTKVMQNGQETAVNTYDELNQLVKTAAAGTTVINAYNGEGFRVSKVVNGVVTRYLYEYDKVVLEVDGSGNQTARNVYGTNLLTRTVDGQNLYYMYNGHADVVALLDASTGDIVGTYYYDAFGNITEQTGDVNNTITYAGYQYDKETGLYYLNSRMYDPKIARFLQEDTYRGEANDPLSLNLYTYVNNNPVLCFLRGINKNNVNSSKSV